MKKLYPKLKNLKDILEIKRARNLPLKLYLLSLGIGLALYLAYTFGPFLVTCSAMASTEFCTPTGVFIILILSYPGYFLVGKLFSLFPQIPWGVSFLVVIAISGYFYYFLGNLIYKIRSGEIKKYTKSKLFLWVALIFLLISLQILI